MSSYLLWDAVVSSVFRSSDHYSPFCYNDHDSRSKSSATYLFNVACIKCSHCTMYILLCNLHNDYLFYDCVFPAAEWMTIRLTIIIVLITSAIITTQPNMVGLLLWFGLFPEQMNTYCLLQKAER